jgi:pantoate--beta-alanine ligase
MIVARTIAQARAALEGQRDIGLVPTMGALHAGHARLIETARAQSGYVAVSIFVNPLQFNQREDYERYARTLPADLDLCQRGGVDLIFAPDASEMYPGEMATFVEVTGLTDHFCGASRPGHFRGVTTVVAKLFHIIQPQLAFFGEKDAQQLAVIARMVHDLDFPIRIVPVETVREPDGLALSSRNQRLSPEERRSAICLYPALLHVRNSIQAGERDAARILAAASPLLDIPLIRVDYFDLADPETLQPVKLVESPVRVLGAIFAGETRLIDNLLISPPTQVPPLPRR